MIRLLLIFLLVTQMGCSVVHTAVGSFVGTLSADIVKDKIDKEDDEAPNVPADGTLGINSDDNIYILKP